MTPWQRAASRAGRRFTRARAGSATSTYLFKQRADIVPTPPVQVDAAAVESRFRWPKRPLGNGKWEAALLVPVGFSYPEYAAQPRTHARGRLDGRRRRAWPSRRDGAGRVASGGRSSDKAQPFGRAVGGDWDAAGTTGQASADGSVAVSAEQRRPARCRAPISASTGVRRTWRLYGGVSRRFERACMQCDRRLVV